MYKQSDYMVRFKNYDHYRCRCINMGCKKNTKRDDRNTTMVKNNKCTLPILLYGLYNFHRSQEQCVMS